MKKLKMHSQNIVDDNIEKIGKHFPNCITESKDKDGNVKRSIDYDQLRQEISDSIIEGPQERYQLNWPGKREALLTANAPIAKTLRPCREESVDFDATQNLFIEGDNLDALKLLQENYLGKIKMIYIDPPYNTGNDFVYNDDFAENSEEFLKKSSQKDEKGNRLVANTESNGRFHSDWLSMMYPRLKVARNLLEDNGVLFLSIGEHEIGGLKLICDNLFGIDNYIGCISRLMKSGGAKGTFFTPNIDYILVYAKSKQSTRPFRMAIAQEQIDTYYNKIEQKGDRQGERYGEERLYLPSLDIRPNQRYWIQCPDGSFAIPPGKHFPERIIEGEKIKPTSEDKVWRWTYDTYKDAKRTDRIIFKETKSSGLVDQNGSQCKYNIYFKLWLKDQQEKGKVPPNYLGKFENRQSSAELRKLDIPFDYAKPKRLLEHLIEIVQIEEGDIVLDYFAGSCTTAHALICRNIKNTNKARFIMVQYPEKCDDNSEAYKAGFKTIAEIGKERIRRAGKQIMDTLKEKHNDTADMFSEEQRATDLDIGFRVLKVDSSNMREVYYNPDVVKQDELKLYTDNIKDNRSSEDLLFQVLLDWGVDLSLPITKEKIADNEVFFVDGNALAACFEKDGKITEDFCKELAKRNPLRAVFRDSGFKDDSVKINVEQIFKLMSPNTDLKVV